MDKIKLAVVDDHTLFRKGLVSIMNQVPEFEVVFQATNGREFLDLLPSNPVDVVLLDLQMPELDGKAVTEILRKDNSEIKIDIFHI